MEVLSLLLSIVALVVAVLAYARTGGVRDLKYQVTNMGSSIETLRSRTADALDKVERLVRGSEKPRSPDQPGDTST
jgi:hypothetical protein